MIGLTSKGRDVARIVRGAGPFESLVTRSDLVATELGRMAATKLKNFAYAVVPEITSLKWGEEIAAADGVSSVPRSPSPPSSSVEG